MECKYCKRETFEELEVCENHIPLLYARVLKSDLTFNQVRSFIKDLSKEFRMNYFDVIASFIENPAYYSYRVSLNLEDETNFESVSHFTLNIGGGTKWGYNEPPSSYYDFFFYWVTSSDHEVTIIGEFGDHESFFVMIGEDESEYFYKTIENTLEQCVKGNEK